MPSETSPGSSGSSDPSNRARGAPGRSPAIAQSITQSEGTETTIGDSETVGIITIAPPQALFVDTGRIGWAHLAVTAAGAFDRRSYRLANRLVGNPETATALELVLGPIEIWFDRAATIALTGITAAVTTHDHPDTRTPRRQHSTHTTLTLPAGVLLRIGVAASGLRGYLAIRGGFDAPVTLGSRSADTMSGLGPPLLTTGAPLSRFAITPTAAQLRWSPVDTWHHAATHVSQHMPLASVHHPTADCVIGLLPPPRPLPNIDTTRMLTESTWVVAPDSNRVGIRLNGSYVELPRDPHAPSEPLIRGAIQLPPDGAPIIMGPDHPTTGGYPVIGAVPEADLDVLAQLRPGSTLRFRPLPT
mgnify:CR=1 FL=1